MSSPKFKKNIRVLSLLGLAACGFLIFYQGGGSSTKVPIVGEITAKESKGKEVINGGESFVSLEQHVRSSGKGAHSHAHAHNDGGVSELVVEENLATWDAQVVAFLKKEYPDRKKVINFVTKSITQENFKALPEIEFQRLLDYAENAFKPQGAELPHLCWSSTTAASVQAAFEQVRAFAINEAESLVPQQVQQATRRWTRTATNGFNTGGDGTPVTLTWGFVREGTVIDNTRGGNLPSNLIARLNETFGAPTTTGDLRTAPWFSLFEDAFRYWSSVTGNIYVYVANDDGASLPSSSGFLGTRADLRIGGVNIDGRANTLAFNYSPNSGDMVIDTGDVFNFTNNASTKALLRNVLAHEHGHGLGFKHVCPVNETKLMEPIATRRFVGVQFDDIITAHGNYGDHLERNGNSRNNNTVATAAVIPNATAGNNLSISTTGDVDFYRMQYPTARRLTVTVTPTQQPPYPEAGSSSSGCTHLAGVNFDPRMRQNLNLRVLDSNGSTVLAVANSAAIGAAERVKNVLLANANQVYYVEVTGGGENATNNNNAQLYNLSIQAVELPPELSVIASDSEAQEFDLSNRAEFTINSSAVASVNIPVAYTVSGSASSGSDFVALAGAATINAGTQTTRIPVTALLDSSVEGDETVVLTLSSSSNYTIAAAAATVTIRDLPFDSYRRENFGSATANTGDTEDFDGDGVHNLVEYALGRSPTTPSAALTSTVREVAGIRKLSLTFEENTTLRDVNYVLETSSSLQSTTWVSAGVTRVNGALVNGRRMVTATIDISGERKFLRLRIERRTAGQ